MHPTLRRSIEPAVRATIRWKPARRELKFRARPLAFETCETRLPLAVILGDPPSIDISPMEDSSAVEIAAASCQTPSALVVGDLPSSDRADRCDRLPVSDESPAESAVAPNDPEDELAWITLDTDAEPVWLAERFDALSSPYEEAMYAELAARLGAMQGLAMDATESERTSPVWPGASSANRLPGQCVEPGKRTPRLDHGRNRAVSAALSQCR
jgi:hypothetical protein